MSFICICFRYGFCGFFLFLLCVFYGYICWGNMRNRFFNLGIVFGSKREEWYYENNVIWD